MSDTFQMETQIGTHWCWAAVSASVNHYFTPESTLRQCEIANKVLGSTTCCSAPLPENMDKTANLEDALRDIGALKEIRAGGKMDPLELHAQIIGASLPVCARIGWPDETAGHFVVICGCPVSASGEQLLDIADSFFGDSTLPYEDFAHSYQGNGEWTDTYLVKHP